MSVLKTGATAWADRTRDEQIAAIVELYRDGLSFGRISVVLGAPTRNVVIGLWNRWRLRTGEAGRRQPVPAAPAVTAPSKPVPISSSSGKRPPAALVVAVLPVTKIAPPPTRLAVDFRRAEPKGESIPRVKGLPAVRPWMRWPVDLDNDLSDQAGRPTLAEVTASQCRFPLWPNDARPRSDEALVCGQPVVPGHSWCASCCRRVYAAGTGL